MKKRIKEMLLVDSLKSARLKNLRLQRHNLTFRVFQSSVEIACLLGAFILAYLLRFDFSIPYEEQVNLLVQLPFVVTLQIIALRVFGAHRFIWRYTSTRDAATIAKTLVGVLMLLFAARSLYLVLPATVIVPISISILDSVLAFIGVLGVRMIRREMYERSNRMTADKSLKKPVILVGAGQAGVLTLAEIKRRGDIDIDVRAFVDDDEAKLGAVINGVKVKGNVNNLPELVKKLGADHVIITIAQGSREQFQKILKICQEIPIKVRTIPGLYELLQGNVTVSRIRDIEVEDLLGREPVELDHNSINKFLKNKVAMVTGAGGSIGSELVRQLVNSKTKQLVLVERSEYALFQIQQEILEKFPDADVTAVIADICDLERMENVFFQFRPNVVFHAAAHKHVPLMETNSSEALKNNVLGTKVVGDLAGQYAADAFVLISTDKAVSPTSIMGATKRVAELVIQDLDREYDTRFLAVRFGNVIGSNGSVIPTFREQIRRGGPVTVTHPDMTRYFMTIPEATQLVLQAGAIGKGGEILILDMGEPVKILDLARQTIKLSGLRPNVDIHIKFTGMRPGEKLSEILESKDEKLEKTAHPKIFVSRIAPYPASLVQEMTNSIPELCRTENEVSIREFLAASLPEATIAIKPGKTKKKPDIVIQRFETKSAAM
ncbi:MAG: polysaccharide biosynthesis protein [Chloracidobacterium sp.]|nr:polysaccharide biosynthesis protein [Chloracidobacterium sp.]